MDDYDYEEIILNFPRGKAVHKKVYQVKTEPKKSFETKSNSTTNNNYQNKYGLQKKYQNYSSSSLSGSNKSFEKTKVDSGGAKESYSSNKSGYRNNYRNQPLKKSTDKWDIEEVVQWLESIGFGHYKENFKEEEIDGEALLCLNKEDLTKLSISKDEMEIFKSNIEKIR